MVIHHKTKIILSMYTSHFTLLRRDFCHNTFRIIVKHPLHHPSLLCKKRRGPYFNFEGNNKRDNVISNTTTVLYV